MKTAALAAFALIGLASLAQAADELKVGDKAPDFTLMGSDGKTYSLADFKGKKGVVLAWFPKADTPGCTAECKSIRDNGSTLKSMNIAYFTASVDKPEANAKFSEKFSMDFPVLSDPEKTTAKAYGVVSGVAPVAKRWTFYIDKDGVIKEIDKKINNPQAGSDIAAKVKALGLGS